MAPRLGPALHILREAGTERLHQPAAEGEAQRTFACAGCGLPLFSSAAKYDSRTGWPSFWKALPNAVAYRRDLSLGMLRTEEHCRRCGGHLGHLFEDGPPPTGKRHCINGLSLRVPACLMLLFLLATWAASSPSFLPASCRCCRSCSPAETGRSCATACHCSPAWRLPSLAWRRWPRSVAAGRSRPIAPGDGSPSPCLPALPCC
jgi:methionine-R-sulfoxide reductase